MQRKLITSVIKTLIPGEKPYEVFDETIPGFILRVQPSGVMTYYLRYRNTKGKRRRYLIGRVSQLSPVQARDEARQLSARVVRGEDVLETRVQTRAMAEAAKHETLRGFLDGKYGPWLKAERPEKRRSTEVIRRIERNFTDLLDRPLLEISAWVTDKWRAAQRQSGKSPNACNRDVALLKAALSKAVEWQIIDRHPLQGYKLLKIDNRGSIRYLDEDEEVRLRHALRQRDVRLKAERERGNSWRRERGYTEYPVLGTYADHIEPLVLMALNTGMRRGELFNLRWTDVDIEKEYLTVEGAGAKSGQTRHIPLSPEARSVLSLWLQQSLGDGYVFPGKNGGRLDNVRKAWEGVLKAAAINNFRFHDLRHSFASKLVMLGEDLNTVRELLGHTSLNMTLRYAHLAPGHTARAVKRIRPPAETIGARSIAHD